MYNKKQRKAIYTLAYKLALKDPSYNNGMCHYLKLAHEKLGYGYLSFYTISLDFIEFMKCMPKNSRIWCFWWSLDEKGWDERFKIFEKLIK